MGLFSFLKNAGAKLFNKAEEEAKKEAPKTPEGKVTNDLLNQMKAKLLLNIVEGLGLPVQGLQVELQGETVVVFGEADSQAAKEKVILALGNVEGVSSVDDRMTVRAQEPEPEAQFYEVKKGDSLSKIAKAFYGNAMKYPVIFEANKPMLKDPDLIYPGQVLRIPPLA